MPRGRSGPVQVVHFPKKDRRGRRSRPAHIQTVETTVPLDADEVLTELVMWPADSKPKRRKKPARRGTPPARNQVTELTELTVLGHRLFTEGRVQEARSIYKSLVALRPHDAFAHTMLGTIHLALGETDRAFSLFEVALSLNPRDIPSRVYRGEIRLARGDSLGARNDLQRAIALADPRDPFSERAARLLGMTRGVAGRAGVGRRTPK